jgi:maltoporin
LCPQLFFALCLIGAPSLGLAQSPEMEQFRKQIEGELSAMKATYESQIKELKSRVETLETENARLQQQTAAAPAPARAVSPEIAALKQRVTELELTADQHSAQAEATGARIQASADAIKAIEIKLHADATETRDIYEDDAGWPFDIKRFYDLPQPFEFHGYLRSGFGMNGEGGKMEAFQAPGAEAKFRLGNEADTYGELALTHNWLRLDDPTAAPYVRTTVRMSVSTGEHFSFDSLNDTTHGNDIALREAYVMAGNVIQSIPDIRFWIGQRYYQRHDIHLDDFFFLDMSGYGGGVEDVPIGKFAKLSLAWLGGSVDHYVTDNGDVAKQNIDLRLTDIKAPGGKVTLWFDYANTKGGLVHDVFNPDGSPFRVQSSAGYAVGLIHRTEDDKLFGGYNEFAIQYGQGAGYNFSSTLNTSGPNLGEAWRFRVLDDFMFQPWEHFGVQAVGLYEETKYGGANSLDRWASLGARPIYFFNDRFSIALEAGVDWAKSEPLGTDGHLWKITLAPQISRGGKYFSRPVLRAFVTYAGWSNGFKGHVGGTAYEDATTGLSYGLQMETWW